MVARNDWQVGAHLSSMSGEDCCRRIAYESEGYETLNVRERADPHPFYGKVENGNGTGGRKASESTDGGGSSGRPSHIGNHEVGESKAKDYVTETWSKTGPGVSLFLSLGRSPQYDDVSLFFPQHPLDPASCSSSYPSYPFLCAM